MNVNRALHVIRCLYYKWVDFLEDQRSFIGATLIFTSTVAIITNHFM